MQRFRENLTIVLLALLPLHALIVTFWTKQILGPGHAPLAGIALWKEALLAAILVLCLLELCGVNEQRTMKHEQRRLDLPDLLLAGLILLSLPSLGSPASLYGFKYTVFPLLLFCILRRVPWSVAFRRGALLILLLVSVDVAVYGLLTLYLPDAFFRILGYSAAHSTYVPWGPIAAFQYVSDLGVRRIQSTFAGPNQFGLYLLLPWTMGVLGALRAWHSPLAKPSWLRRLRTLLPGVTVAPGATFALGVGLTILLTFSRSAWVGAVVVALVALVIFPPDRSPFTVRHPLLIVFALSTFLFLLFLLSPSLLLRPTSTADHIARPMEAMAILLREPYGRGLGSAGPAQHRSSDACMQFPLGADTRWATSRPDLCIFRGGIQVQPRDRACHCPLIPENWYLQVGVELGVVGMLLFIAFLIVVLRRLAPGARQLSHHPAILRSLAFLFLLGISVSGFFLHSFEDSAVAYTAWILAAVSFPANYRGQASIEV